IFPVLTHIPAVRHAAVARLVRGEWLPLDTALHQLSLSPTARTVLEQVGPLAAGHADRRPPVLLGSARDRAWTEQLLAARAGDLQMFGSLFEEMTPSLDRALRSCSWTRALGRLGEVEDVLHDAATRALEQLETFNPCLGTASGWMWAITRNCGVSRLRAHSRF